METTKRKKSTSKNYQEWIQLENNNKKDLRLIIQLLYNLSSFQNDSHIFIYILKLYITEFLLGNIYSYMKWYLI